MKNSIHPAILWVRGLGKTLVAEIFICGIAVGMIFSVANNLTATNVIPLVAVVVAALALNENRRNNVEKRRHDLLSSMPYLSTLMNMETLESGGIRFTYTLQNLGLGTAILKSFELYLDGINSNVKNFTDVRNNVRKALNKYKIFDEKYFHYKAGSAMSKDERIILASFIVFPDEKFDLDLLKADWQRQRLIIEYESMYKIEATPFDTNNYLD